MVDVVESCLHQNPTLAAGCSRIKNHTPRTLHGSRIMSACVPNQVPGMPDEIEHGPLRLEKGAPCAIGYKLRSFLLQKKSIRTLGLKPESEFMDDPVRAGNN